MYYLEYQATDGMDDYGRSSYFEESFESLKDLAIFIDFQTYRDSQFKVDMVKRLFDLTEHEKLEMADFIEKAKQDRLERQKKEAEERKLQEELNKKKRERDQYKLYLELKEKFGDK